MTIPETDPNQLLDYFFKILFYHASKVYVPGTIYRCRVLYLLSITWSCSAMYIKSPVEAVLRYSYLTPQYCVLCWNEA